MNDPKYIPYLEATFADIRELKENQWKVIYNTALVYSLIPLSCELIKTPIPLGFKILFLLTWIITTCVAFFFFKTTHDALKLAQKRKDKILTHYSLIPDVIQNENLHKENGSHRGLEISSYLCIILFLLSFGSALIFTHILFPDFLGKLFKSNNPTFPTCFDPCKN